MEQKRGKVFALIGPTAVGKNTLLDALCERIPGLIRMPSATTRPAREGEISGVSKVFLNDAEFDEAIARDEFVEWQVIHGYRYGVLKRIIHDRIEQGKDYVADIEVLGAMKLKETYGDDVVLLFIVPPSLAALEQRIQVRGTENESEKALRLSRSKAELTFLPQCDYVVMNDNLFLAIETMAALVNQAQTSGSSRVQRHQELTATVLLVSAQEQAFLQEIGSAVPLSFSISLTGHAPIHEQIQAKMRTLNIEGTILTDGRFDPMQNKGLEMPQPLWAHFDQNADGMLRVQYLYVVRVTIDDPIRFQTQPFSVVTQVSDFPMDQTVFLKEIPHYV